MGGCSGLSSPQQPCRGQTGKYAMAPWLSYGLNASTELVGRSSALCTQGFPSSLSTCTPALGKVCTLIPSHVCLSSLLTASKHASNTL